MHTRIWSYISLKTPQFGGSQKTFCKWQTFLVFKLKNPCACVNLLLKHSKTSHSLLYIPSRICGTYHIYGLYGLFFNANGQKCMFYIIFLDQPASLFRRPILCNRELDCPVFYSHCLIVPIMTSVSRDREQLNRDRDRECESVSQSRGDDSSNFPGEQLQL